MEDPKHPIKYTIFLPNILINFARTELKGYEIGVYNEILNENHKEAPEQLTYKVPYENIYGRITKNIARDKKRIAKTLQGKSIYLDKKYMEAVYGEGSARTVVIFPEISYEDDHLEIHLHPKFKKLLTIFDFGFTKGDIETLRKFKHDISHPFYWLARQKQSFQRNWVVSVEEFRDVLGISGYDDWRNFRKRIMNSIEDDMKGTWMEFDIQYKKKGKGGSVKEIEFNFKNGPIEEKNTPIGSEKWEAMLQRMNINEQAIKTIRGCVNVGLEDILPDGRKIIWDVNYIVWSAEAAKVEFDKKAKNSNLKQIENLAAWFIEGIRKGYWLNYVEDKRKKLFKDTQGSLFI
jgi:hypothetical protein